MKKLITWLSKGSKVVKVLKYIYRALIIANRTVEGGQHGAEEAEVPEKYIEKISTTQKYLEVAIEYLGIILGWFGVSETEKGALSGNLEAKDGETAAPVETPIQLKDLCEEVIG